MRELELFKLGSSASLNAAISRRLDCDPSLKLKHVASGVEGSVYELGGKRALKITREKSNAKTYHKAMTKKRIFGVVSVLDVFSARSDDVVYYFIVMRDASPLDSETASAVFEIFSDVLWHRSPEVFVRPRLLAEAESAVLEIQSNYLDKKRAAKIASCWAWMKKTAAALAQHDIYVKDFNENNVMLQGGKLVLVDLGSGRGGSALNLVDSVRGAV